MKALSLESLEDPSLRRIAAEQTATSIQVLPIVQALARRQSPRIAIKVKGKILFIHSGDVVAIQAQGNYVSLQRGANSYLLRDSISVVAEKQMKGGKEYTVTRTYKKNLRFLAKLWISTGAFFLD